MIEGHKITLKLELPTMPWVMLGKCFNGEGNAQKYSIINGNGLDRNRSPGECEEVLMSGSPFSPKSGSGAP